MIIIPAIDIIDGRCVRLSQGDYAQRTTYHDNPVEVAKMFEGAGFERLHVVDLDGARSAGVVNIGTLERICGATGLSVDFGGGIKSDRDLRLTFEAGADFACVGSMAAADPQTTLDWLERYGAGRLIISADVRGGSVRTHGWMEDGGMTIDEFIGLYEGRVRQLMCTDIDRDGMLCGAATGLYARLTATWPWLDVIASGGVGSMDDIRALPATGVSGVVVGKAIYEGKITPEQLRGLF